MAKADFRVEPVLHGGQPQSFEPGDRRVERGALLQPDVLHSRAAPQSECLAEQPGPLRIRVGAGLADEPFKPRGVDIVRGDPQPVAVCLSLDQPVRQCLAQPGSEPLQGIHRVGRRTLAPDPVDERRLRDYVTRFERERDQQPAQPSARHLRDDAVVRACLEWPKHPDLHEVILPCDYRSVITFAVIRAAASEAR